MWVIQNLTNVRLGTIHVAVKAVRRLLPIVGLYCASPTIVDDACNEIDVSVEEIDPLPLYDEACSPVDPTSPLSQISYDGVGNVVQFTG